MTFANFVVETSPSSPQYPPLSSSQHWEDNQALLLKITHLNIVIEHELSF